jgi:hypothetical protein
MLLSIHEEVIRQPKDEKDMTQAEFIIAQKLIPDKSTIKQIKGRAAIVDSEDGTGRKNAGARKLKGDFSQVDQPKAKLSRNGQNSLLVPLGNTSIPCSSTQSFSNLQAQGEQLLAALLAQVQSKSSQPDSISSVTTSSVSTSSDGGLVDCPNCDRKVNVAKFTDCWGCGYPVKPSVL